MDAHGQGVGGLKSAILCGRLKWMTPYSVYNVKNLGTFCNALLMVINIIILRIKFIQIFINSFFIFAGASLNTPLEE